MDIQFHQYDEDLSKNPFFRRLQSEHKIILDTAPLENWIICIPRLATIKPDNLLNPDYLLSHILIPDSELPDSHFTNLLGKDIKLINQCVLSTADKRIESTILFEEIYYTKGLLKYKVWCIELSLSDGLSASLSMEDPVDVNSKTNGENNSSILIVRDLKDAMELLLNETGSKIVFRKIDNACNIFLRNNNKTDNLIQVKKSIQLLIGHCLQTVIFPRKTKEKCRVDVQFYKILKISLETYIINNLYEFLFDYVIVNNLEENEQFNKICRQFTDITAAHLNIDSKHNAVITCLRVELLKIEGLQTAIEKLGCLKRALNAASRTHSLSIDELIPIFVFIIIKSGLTHWTSTLIFLKEFIFTELTNDSEKGAESFLITTLEAAIIYIKSLKHRNPLELKNSKHSLLPSTTHLSASTLSLPSPSSASPSSSASTSSNSDCAINLKYKFTSKDDFLEYFFELIRLSNEYEIIKLFKNNTPDEIMEISVNDKNSTSTASSCDTDLSLKNFVTGIELVKTSKLLPTLCHPLCNCTDCLEKLKDIQPPTINSQNSNGLTALHVAAMYGLTKMLNLVLALNGNLNITDENNWTPLHYAAANGHQNTLLLLLHAGADINVETCDKFTPLHLSCLNGHQGCCKAILYYADHMRVIVNINGQTKYGDTALHFASKWGFIEIVETLLEYDIKNNVSNRFGHTPRDYAHNSIIAKLLNNTFMLKEQVNNNNNNHLNEHINGNGVIDKNNVNINNNNNNNNNNNDINNKNIQLKHEIFRGCIRYDQLNLYIDNNRRIIDKIIAAIRNGDTKLAKYFLESNLMAKNDTEARISNNKNINGISEQPQTSSTILSETEQNSIKKFSIDLNTFNSDGQTPLHVAIECGNIELIKYLLANGSSMTVNLNARSNENILHLAILTKSFQIVECILMEVKNVDIIINEKDIHGDTPLHYAVRVGNRKILEILLASGANWKNIRNNKNETVMDVAKFYMYFNIIDLLENLETNEITSIEEELIVHSNKKSI